MKKILTLTLIISLATLLFASCGSSKGGGNCDAYGSVDTEQNTDVASK